MVVLQILKLFLVHRGHGGMVAYGDVVKCPQKAHTFEHLVSSWWHYLGGLLEEVVAKDRL